MGISSQAAAFQDLWGIQTINTKEYNYSMKKLYRQFLLLGYFGGSSELFQTKQINKNIPKKLALILQISPSGLCLWHLQDQPTPYPSSSSCLKKSHEQDCSQPLELYFRIPRVSR